MANVSHLIMLAFHGKQIDRKQVVCEIVAYEGIESHVHGSGKY